MGLGFGGHQLHLEAVLHLHPFHTVHVRAAHELFPSAKLYGTARHADKLGDLPWEPLHTEDAELHSAFAEDLAFSVPRGVDFVSSDPNLHFSSVLALHRASKTLHVDDTLVALAFSGQPPGPTRHLYCSADFPDDWLARIDAALPAVETGDGNGAERR